MPSAPARNRRSDRFVQVGVNSSASTGAAIGGVMFLFAALFAGFIALIVFAVMQAARHDRARREQLWAHAMRFGWRAFAPGEPAPSAVASEAGSGRTKLALVTRLHGYDVWLVWHQWTETSSSGDSTTSSTHHLTRYYLWPHSMRPDVRLSRRTRLGASLMAVRGAGTGDAEFDRNFMVHTAAPVYLPDGVRYGMMTGDLPIWQISAGALVTSYADPPRAENLQYRADVIVRLVHALGG